MGHKRSEGIVLLSSLGLLVACSAAPPPLIGRNLPREHVWTTVSPQRQSRDARAVVVQRARRTLNGEALSVRGLSFEADPVGFAQACFWDAGIDLLQRWSAVDPDMDSLSQLYHAARRHGSLHTHQPRAGDLIFWGPRPGEQREPIQLGVVTQVEADGTIHSMGVFQEGPQRIRTNLRHPAQEQDASGKRINHLLGRPNPQTSAQLFRAFADPY